jgi:hypothetical protein
MYGLFVLSLDELRRASMRAWVLGAIATAERVDAEIERRCGGEHAKAA